MEASAREEAREHDRKGAAAGVGTPDQQVPGEAPHKQSHHWLGPLSHHRPEAKGFQSSLSAVSIQRLTARTPSKQIEIMRLRRHEVSLLVSLAVPISENFIHFRNVKVVRRIITF